MRKICVTAIGLLLLIVTIGSPEAIGKSKGHGHKPKKPCPRGTVRIHGKCRTNRVQEVVSGEWSGPYSKAQVKAGGKSIAITLVQYPCYDPQGRGQYALEDGPVQGSMSKSSVGAKVTASGSYSKAGYYGETQNFTWELTGTFKTRTNFSGDLHIVVDETVTSPYVAPSHCDAHEHYELGFAG